MSWKKIAGTVGNVAGSLAPLLGGPAGLFLLLMLAAQMGVLFVFQIPEGNRDLLVYLSGNFLPFVSAAVYYWVSSTKDATQREKLMTMTGSGQAGSSQQKAED
ncbi:hypothetical protein [Alkalimonas mucilaginosa]|uniref:Uncharacterized protein n=1 Tax=Alkalimonas mucilaginosa TaxID=3057676 RepID=A0ABU7JEZ6_9GAMM|nr:hypothetical protein [Alkalimonas sp. MEB004]MEE2023588.1 hypothetical protein [Alkalimonas sp. MEB004]